MIDLRTELLRLADHLAVAVFQYTTEDELQAAVTAELARVGASPVREYRLSDGRSRVDIWLTPFEDWDLPVTQGVALELKIDGTAADVRRQLDRYAACPEVEGIILVTTRSKHHHLPPTMNGKPVLLCSLIGAGL